MRSIKNAGCGLLLALQFLTQLPIRASLPWTPATARWALRCFPIAGLAVGGVAALALALSGGRADWLGALIVLTAWIAATGALHLEGWMDVTDAAMSQARGDRQWAIMKDPHVGSFAVVSVALLLAWKLALIHELLQAGNGLDTAAFWLGLPAIARFGALLYMRAVPSARPEGLGAEWKRNLRTSDLAAALLVVALPVWFEPRLLWALAAAAAWTLAYGWWSRLRFGGMNGDLTGAYIEGAELVMLLGLWGCYG